MSLELFPLLAGLLCLNGSSALCCGSSRGSNFFLFHIRRGNHFLVSVFCSRGFSTYSYSLGTRIYAFSLYLIFDMFNGGICSALFSSASSSGKENKKFYNGTFYPGLSKFRVIGCWWWLWLPWIHGENFREVLDPEIFLDLREYGSPVIQGRQAIHRQPRPQLTPAFPPVRNVPPRGSILRRKRFRVCSGQKIRQWKRCPRPWKSPF